MWLSGFLVIILKYSAFAYNLDVENAQVFNAPRSINYKRGCYFGFSVALFANGKDSVLLVGAPKANTSVAKYVIEPGTVYKCSINDTCKEWIIHKTGKTEPLNKNNAWIGATIAIENTTIPRVVVCGPRWVRGDHLHGICYWTIINDIKNFKNAVNKYEVFEDFQKKISKSTYLLNQVGFSLHMRTTNLEWNLILGIPSAYSLNGTTNLFIELNNGPMKTILPSYQDHTFNKELFGYATTSGYYFNKKILLFAFGAPKDRNMHGSVTIFTFPKHNNKALSIKKIVTGKQYGEYFGAALASCDLNGDSKDELIVGAPQWSKDTDEGRIYAFIALHNENFERQLFDGEASGSRFGSVITCLGDINYDGYNDIAVGAPYEEQTGAIYIFNGNSNGLPKRYSQKIIGTQLGENIRGFGISIAEPRDINGDGYPDIAVGAYLSDQVILIKSIPVVTITTRLIYNEKAMLLRNSTGFFIQMCTSYNGISVPNNLEIVEFLNIDETYKRAFHGIGERNVNIYESFSILLKSKELCKQVEIRLKENIQNVIDPLKISASVMLKEQPQLKKKNMKSNLFCTTCATINKLLSKAADLIKLPFFIDCGEDNICKSDVETILSTNLTFNNRYIIGSTSTIKFIVDASNYGEPAYQAKIYVYIPEILSLARIPPSCTENSHTNNTLKLICDIGNPLKTNEMLVLELDMSEVRFHIDHVNIWTNFSTQSEEKTLLNNMNNLTIYFDVDVDIVIAGKAQEDLYSYFSENNKRHLTNVQFRHIYEVQKFGASPIEEAIVIINVPTYWKHSTGDIQIINVNQTIAYMDGQQFYCTHSNFTSSTFIIRKPKVYDTYTESNVKGKLKQKSNDLISLPPNDRSMYMNCTNTNVKCTYINCKFGPFISPATVAKLSLILDIYSINLKSNITEGRDIIFFLSEGSVFISQPYNITQKPNSAMVATTFLGTPKAKQVATWIKILSIVLGILLFALLILGLIKVGFFNRKKKEELEALKSETNDVCYFAAEPWLTRNQYIKGSY